MSQLSVVVEELGPVQVVKIQGVLHLTGALSFAHIMNDLLRSPSPQFVLDGTKLHYLDGAGLETLLTCQQKLRQAGGDLRLAAFKPLS